MHEHRLAAIMFTDIVGYTALMGSDEDLAFKVLTRIIHRPKIYDILGWVAVSDLNFVGDLEIYCQQYVFRCQYFIWFCLKKGFFL